MKTPGMHIFVAGVNHSTTPIEIREKLAVITSQISNALDMLGDYVRQGLILSTCNRTEIYSVGKRDPISQTGNIDFFKKWSKLTETDLLPYFYFYQGEAAVKHLFRIAAGLDSMIIGEFEILGQVKQSLEEAEKAGLVDLPLRNLFIHALQVGRRVRERTDISKNALSVSSVAVDLAVKAIGDLNNRKALIIGTGEAGWLVAKALRERGISQITVASRSQDNASGLATALQGKAVNISNLSEELGICDIVISCTGAPHIILDHQAVEHAMNVRSHRPLVLIDIAVPRDIAPEARQIRNIFLYDIDDLIHLSELNRRQREKEVHSATKIIEAEVERFDSWWQATEVKPIISRLTNKAEAIRKRQLELTLKRLPPFSPEELPRLEAMTKSIVQKILHDPIQCLKKNTTDNDDYISLVNELFHLDKE